MAKQVNFTHANGTVYPSSYWRITKLEVDVPRAYALFVFSGYKDQAARQAGKAIIGVRKITIEGSDFLKHFNEVTSKAKNPQEVGYEYCSKVKDIPTTVTTTKTVSTQKTVKDEQTGEETVVTEEKEVIEETTVHVSFFEQALDV